MLPERQHISWFDPGADLPVANPIQITGSDYRLRRLSTSANPSSRALASRRAGISSSHRTGRRSGRGDHEQPASDVDCATSEQGWSPRATPRALRPAPSPRLSPDGSIALLLAIRLVPRQQQFTPKPMKFCLDPSASRVPDLGQGLLHEAKAFLRTICSPVGIGQQARK